MAAGSQCTRLEPPTIKSKHHFWMWTLWAHSWTITIMQDGFATSLATCLGSKMQSCSQWLLEAFLSYTMVMNNSSAVAMIQQTENHSGTLWTLIRWCTNTSKRSTLLERLLKSGTRHTKKDTWLTTSSHSTKVKCLLWPLTNGTPLISKCLTLLTQTVLSFATYSGQTTTAKLLCKVKYSLTSKTAKLKFGCLKPAAISQTSLLNDSIKYENWFFDNCRACCCFTR